MNSVTHVRVLRNRWWAAPAAYKYAVYAWLAGW